MMMVIPKKWSYPKWCATTNRITKQWKHEFYGLTNKNGSFSAHKVTKQKWVHKVLGVFVSELKLYTRECSWCLSNSSRLLHLSEFFAENLTFWEFLSRSCSNKRLKWFNKVQQSWIGRCKWFRSVREAGIASKELPHTPFWLSSFLPLSDVLLQRKRIAISINQNISAENSIKTFFEVKNGSIFILNQLPVSAGD